MILYHFTCLEYLESIKREGLNRGEVPLSSTEVLNAVNLTSDKTRNGHGLDGGGVEITPAARKLMGASVGSRFPDKLAVRLTVLIPRNDRKLVKWPTWAKKRLDSKWYQRMDQIGGGKSKTWFLYWGEIPPAWIRAIDIDEERLRGCIARGEIVVDVAENGDQIYRQL